MDDKRRKRLIWQIPFLLFLIGGTMFIIRQQRQVPYQHNSGFVFGTVYNITYQSEKDLQKGIEAELKKVDNDLSVFNEQSVISQINRGGHPDITGTMFEEVFNMAIDISEDTDGAFDITVAPLVNAWGFGFKHGQPPGRHQVDSLKQLVDFNKLQVVTQHGKTVISKPDNRIMLDCSAIAKGYGSDVVARYLQKSGVKNFMVEIGGEVVTRGISSKRVPWKIGVTKPNDDSLNVNQEIQTVLNVTDKAMATSGNYRNFYYKGGKKYTHTIDPKTGYPVQHSILSATVLAQSCAVADAYATAFMVMGIEKAKKLLEHRPELMAYFIYSDKNGRNAIWFSPSLRDKIQK